MQQRCTKADHKNQPLIGVCLDPSCTSQRPYCNSCLSSHSKHIEKLTSFLMLDEWYYLRTNSLHKIQNFIQKCQKVIEILNQFIIPIQNITLQEIQESSLSQVDQIIKHLIQLERIEIGSFSKINFLIQTFDEIGENLSKLKNQQQQKQQQIGIAIERNKQDDLNLLKSQDEQFFSRLNWANTPFDENSEQINDQPSGNINSIKNDQEQKFDENIISNNNLEVFKNYQYDWQYSQLEKIPSVEFQPENKNIELQKKQDIDNQFEQISLDNQLEQTSFINLEILKVNKIKVRFTNLQNNLNILVSQEDKTLRFSPFSLDIYNYLDSYIIPMHGVHKFAFKIQSIGKAIYIGVADSEILKKSDYKPNLEVIRHGTYLISNTGQTYSHIAQACNQNNNQLHFFSNDIIIIEVNMDNQIITWTKQSSPEEQFTMKFEQSQSLSPFVRLSSQKPFHSVIEVYEDFL